jgi:methionyl-tRNA formyltransferase
MTSRRVIFFGTPAFAVPSLLRLVDAGYQVVAAVSQPDRPAGRGQQLASGAVKREAARLGIPVLQPERLKDEAFLRELTALAPDLGVVAAYGKILPGAVLNVPPLGLLNVHASLLPRWRGASPVHRAVMAGDAETGVSIMRVVAALDAGPVYDTAPRAIEPDETSEEVEHDLAAIGANLLVRVVGALIRGEARATPQDDALATYAPPLKKEEGSMRWERPARALHDQVRGLHPWPHAFTSLEGSRVIVHRSSVPVTEAAGAPGDVVSVDREGIVVATGDGTLRLVRLQAEGRRTLEARDFAAGSRLKAGARFGA